MRKRNRILSALLAAFMLAALVMAAPGAALAESALATGTVNTGKLNIRSGPGLNKSIAGTLNKGDTVNIYEMYGEWLRIDGGYVRGSYILVNAPSSPFYGLGRTTGQVHLRAKASTDSSKLATLDTDTGLTLLTKAKDGWYAVRVQKSGKEGYVSSRYVALVSNAKEVLTNDGKQATITGAGVNLRSGPGTSYKSLARLSKNTAVKVISLSGNWYQVKVTSTGKTGYVYHSYVRVSSISNTTPTPTAKVEANAYISSGGVNMRAGAGTSYKSLGKLTKNTQVAVLGILGDWYYVQLSSTGQAGYVYKTYVKYNAATPAPTSKASANGYITGSGVNYRSGAGSSYKSLGQLSKNTSVAVMAVLGDWYYIQVVSTGKAGYVHKKYVALTAATPTPTPTPTCTNKAANGFINDAWVNMRSGAGTSHASLGQLVRNTQVAVLGIAGDWYYIQVVSTGETGYVYKSYVTLLGVSAAIPTPTPIPAAEMRTPVIGIDAVG